ncbi:hypothetical protein ES708_25117 [subsurface metagenome]
MILLEAGNLLDALIVEDILVGQFQQALSLAQGKNHPVLLGGLAWGPVLEHGAQVPAFLTGEYLIHHIGLQRLVDQGLDLPVYITWFLPDGPELGLCAGGAEFGVVYGQCHDDLAIDKQPRYFFRFLVADHLADGLVHRLALAGHHQIRALALDYHQRDAIHEADQVRPAGLLARLTHPLNRELIGDVEIVIGPVIPIDILEGEAAPVLVHSLGQAFAKGQQIIHRFTGAHQTFVQGKVGDGPQGVVDVCGAEVVGLALPTDAVVGADPVPQFIRQYHPIPATTTELQSLLWRKVFKAQVDEQLQGRYVADGVFGVGEWVMIRQTSSVQL